MSNPLLEQTAKEFIEEVRDRVLRAKEPHFLGNWAVVRNNDVFVKLVRHLDDEQKDALWKLLEETVDSTIDAAFRYIDHKRVIGRMRLTLADPETEAEILLTEDDDLNDNFWFEWLDKYARATQRPKTRRSALARDELPRELLTAIAEDFPGVEIISQEQEVLEPDGRPILYHVCLAGYGSPIAFRPDGGRARVIG